MKPFTFLVIACLLSACAVGGNVNYITYDASVSQGNETEVLVDAMLDNSK